MSSDSPVLPGAAWSRPELPPTAYLSGLEVHQEEDMHTVAEATVLYTVPSLYPAQSWRFPDGMLLAEQTPVRLGLQFRATQGWDFRGYIASVQVLGDADKLRSSVAVQVPVKYTIVGTSFLMQSQMVRNWSGTASYIARAIAKQHGLRPVVTTHKRVFEYRLQAGVSDWQFLRQIADRVNYRLIVDDSTLFFTPRDIPLRQELASVPVVTMNRAMGIRDTLIEFKANTGDTDPAGGLRQTSEVTVLRPAASRAVHTPPRPQGPAAFTRRYSTLPAHSYDEATELLDAAADPLWVTATAMCNGDPRLRPGNLVHLEGNAVDPVNKGLWLIRKATHSVQHKPGYPLYNSYFCHLDLGRDQPDRLTLPAVPLDLGNDRGTVLVSDRWRAALIEEGIR